MRAYWAVVSARFRMLLQYRAAAVAGFGTQVFWGLMRMMIFEAFYHSSTADQPMTFPQVVTYVWLGQAMLAMFPWNIDADIRTMMRSGTVAYELLRPIDLYWLWFSRAIAMRTAPTILRAMPMFILAILFFNMQLPVSWSAGSVWVLSTFAALLLSCAITTVLAISLFWTIAGDGISRFIFACVMIFSGMIVPLPFFPDWAQRIINYMPFRGVSDIPFRLYTGNIPAENALPVIAHQIGWTIALIVLGRLILARGTRRLVVQGG
ncbi:MAG: ABC transporter permease [Armatimonadota bacterium]